MTRPPLLVMLAMFCAACDGANPTEVHSNEQFQQLVAIAGTKLVVVDFFAVWCASCRIIDPLYVDLAQRYPQVVFLKVDVDENPSLAGAQEITTIPSFLFLKGGVRVDLLRGAYSAALEDKVKRYAAMGD